MQSLLEQRCRGSEAVTSVEKIGVVLVMWPHAGIATESSNSDSMTQATSYSRLLHSSQFIVSLVVAQFILSFCDPLTMYAFAKAQL